jgi:lactoylglutathione lyase
VISIAHVALWARDLEAMREFYVRQLGGRSGPRYDNATTGFSSCFISFGAGPRIELMHRPGVPSRPEGAATGYAHVALSLDGRPAVDAAVERLRQAGVTVESGPRETGDGYYEAVIVDPEGNRIELTA